MGPVSSGGRNDTLSASFKTCCWKCRWHRRVTGPQFLPFQMVVHGYSLTFFSGYTGSDHLSCHVACWWQSLSLNSIQVDWVPLLPPLFTVLSWALLGLLTLKARQIVTRDRAFTAVDPRPWHLLPQEVCLAPLATKPKPVLLLPWLKTTLDWL